MKQEVASPKNYSGDLYELLTGYCRSKDPDLVSKFPVRFIKNLYQSQNDHPKADVYFKPNNFYFLRILCSLRYFSSVLRRRKWPFRDIRNMISYHI